MIPALKVIDDFHPDPYALRHRVLQSEFKDHTGPDDAKYHASLYHEPLLLQCLQASVGYMVVPRVQGWRLDLDGTMPHSFCHSDEICASFASVFYLNTPEQCRGGTSFYRHKARGIDAMPAGLPKPEIEAIVNDWKVESAWEETNRVAMKFNRFIFYPVQYFHARYPQMGWGKDKQDGRLVWVCFFDVDTRYIVR
jgi:hypothetical protein